MLVHKRTMGVLAFLWTGESSTASSWGHPAPVMMEATLRRLPELDPEEWWEVPYHSPLGKKCCRLYPEMEPVLDESGQLTDVQRSGEEEDHGPQELSSDELKRREEALARGYAGKRRLRPKGLMPFLSPLT